MDNSVDKQEQDIFVSVGQGEQLYLKRISRRQDGPAILMAHGVMANGRIFYSESGKGLAHFLAEAGYDVFVADLRGRGKSWPKIARGAEHGQTEIICEDLPALHRHIRRLRPDAAVHWMAHSWGGVHMSSSLLRFPDINADVASLVYFGSKRSIGVRNLNKLVEVDLVWNLLARVAIRCCGYLPARKLGLGADDETDKSHQQSKVWAKQNPWTDSDDGFDYAAAARRLSLPPALYFAAVNDPCRGHAEDVKRFAEESGPHLARLRLLGKAKGHWHNYDHVSLLTHPDAARDHFPLVLHWLSGNFDKIISNF